MNASKLNASRTVGISGIILCWNAEYGLAIKLIEKLPQLLADYLLVGGRSKAYGRAISIQTCFQYYNILL